MISALFRRHAASSCQLRQLSSFRAWQIDSWGGQLRLNPSMGRPVLLSPQQILVRVKAASVNVIDTVQCDGYGREMLSAMNKVANCSPSETRLPFIPGKDCAGVVEAVGPAVRRFKIGDKVMGVTQAVSPHGTHADYVALDESAAAKMPDNITFEGAASLPYVTCTAWAALIAVARIDKKNASRQRVLIHGGAGGVGTAAIQLLKAWGVQKIVVTASPDSFDTLRSLGVIPVDYKSSGATEKIIREGPYEVILDCVDSPLSRWSDKILGSWRNCVHVSVVSPMLADTDRYGLPIGLASTAFKYFNRSYQTICQGKWFSYAYFYPSQECLQELEELLRNNKMKPMIERVLPFSDLPQAFESVSRRKGRGKTVIQMA